MFQIYYKTNSTYHLDLQQGNILSISSAWVDNESVVHHQYNVIMTEDGIQEM